MTHPLHFFLAATVLTIGWAGTAAADSRPVVLELFTSEGCSSCPPAELILNELAQRPHVLALSFHVDYWDNLGWHDRYSLASATERQRRYAQSLHRASVYTPQAVIDGTEDIVGSQRTAVTQAVSAPREGVPTAVHVVDGSIRIQVGAHPGFTAADVMLVCYLREATTSIGRGENSGRTLKESNIVLSLQPLGQWDGQAREFQIRQEMLPQQTTDVAVLVQAKGQGAILGAAAEAIR